MKGVQKNKFGQYFTPEAVADFMIQLADTRKKDAVLEPSCGHGVFLRLLKKKGFKNITAFEIDPCLSGEFNFVRHESFISAQTHKKFDLVIGNPPYIRWSNLDKALKKELLQNDLWKKYFNSLCDYLYIFILKSIELLNENGQLIFICPEYWMNTTHSVSLRNYMITHGYFESVHHFNETPVFENARLSLIIFKFIKTRKNRREKIRICKYQSSKILTKAILSSLHKNEKIKGAEYYLADSFKKDERWLLAPYKVKKEIERFEAKCGVVHRRPETKRKYHALGEICEVGNGLVSGLDKAFQINNVALTQKEKKATLKVIKAKNLGPYIHQETTPYIFLENNLSEKDLKENFPNFYRQLNVYKQELLSRYNYNRKINFWEWVFLRNFLLFSKPQPRIFIPCKERISNKDHFRFAFVEPGIYPTQDVTAIFKKENTRESIFYILAMLNNHRTFHWLKFKGISKGSVIEFSEKPINSIPIKLICWENKKEVAVHDQIAELCEKYIRLQKTEILTALNDKIDELFLIEPQ